MNTFVIDKNSTNIIAVLSGPRHLHDMTGYPESDYVAVEFSGNGTNKKGALIDGEWQLIDDIEKMLAEAKALKIFDVRSHKEQILGIGISYPGEYRDNGWTAGDISISLLGKDYNVFRMLAERIVLNSNVDPGNEDSQLLRGRASYKMNFPGQRRIIFNTAAEATAFIGSCENILSVADIIEEEKIEEIQDLSSIDDINSYDITSGWEELNGS